MKQLLIGILVVAAILACVGFFLPTDYHIEEKVTIKTSALRVHEFVGDLEKWDLWSPWKEADPTIVVVYGHQTRGVGASQTWTGADGDGELTFTRSHPDTGIAYDMVFITDGKRSPAKCEMNYRAKGTGTGTEVIWIMEGDIADMAPPILGGYMNLFMKMAVSGMFQDGLEQLKLQAEA